MRALERGGQLRRVPAEQIIVLSLARERHRLVQRERLEEDLRVAGAGQLRQRDERAACDPPEGLGVGITGHPGDIYQGQVDVPQDEAVDEVPPARIGPSAVPIRTADSAQSTTADGQPMCGYR